MKLTRICIAVLTAFILLISLTGCLTHVFGENVDNFAEYKKDGTVPIPDGISTVVYVSKDYSTADKTEFVVKSLDDESENIIFTGHLGYEIDYAVVDKDNELLYYTFSNCRSESPDTYLIVYDLAAMQEVNKFLILDDSKNERVDFMPRLYLMDILFDETNNKVIIMLHNTKHSKYEYLSYDIETEEIEELGLSRHYDDIFKELHIIKDGDTHIYDILLINTLFVTDHFDYKPKYAGVYVYDGENNIRLTKSNHELGRPFWFDDKKYVICGSYVYDTAGKMHERKIADGMIKAVY